MNKGFMFKSLRVIVVLVLSVLITVLLITLRPKAKRVEQKETGILVEAISAKSQNKNMVIETYGTVKPREILKLIAEVKGKIVALSPDFKEGYFIKKGTVLVEIDPRAYQLEVERRRVQIDQIGAELKHLRQETKNLKASIKIAASDAALAEAEFYRLKKLMERKVVAKTTLDKANQKYLASLERLQEFKNRMALTGPQEENLKAQRSMAGVLHRQAELDLEKTRIVSPFDGWVLEKNVEIGLHVQIGQYLGGIYNNGALDVEVRIPVKDLKWIPHDLTRDIKTEAEIFFTSDYGNAIWKGKVTRMLAKMDEKTRTLPAVIEVDVPAVTGKHSGSLRLRPGMFVTVKIKGEKIKHIFVMPRHVVHKGSVVYTVKDHRLKIKPVNVVRRYKDSVFIDKGLSEGELVITTPLSGAEEGMQVRMKVSGR